MIQVTLISLYGEKEAKLTKLITDCQIAVKQTLGDAFTPYDFRQIHATIVGLERRIGSAYQNLNFWKWKQREVQMYLDGFLNFFRRCSHIPFKAQVGGFGDRGYPFLSDPFERGESDRPYDRSFSIRGDKVVVMGWPLRGLPRKSPPAQPHEFVQESRTYPQTLDEIRHTAQKFGILHGYHRTPTAVDNDLFFRIGILKANPHDTDIGKSLAKQIRTTLSAREPVCVEITLDDLYVAAYDDDSLPLKTTQVWSLADRRVSGQFVADLYR
ncbi:MAG: hypothetical protein ABH878_06945 [bacterium]